jgi:hypothetical protein
MWMRGYYCEDAIIKQEKYGKVYLNLIRRIYEKNYKYLSNYIF